MSASSVNSRSLPPGQMGMPFIGETIEFIFNSQSFARERHQKYGEIFKTCVFGKPTIFVSGAKACRFVLDNENIYFQNDLPSNIKKLLGKSALSVQTGEEHQERRNLLRKAFTPDYIANQTETIQKVTLNYFNRWENLHEFQWYPELRDYAFDLACELFIGVNRASELGGLLKVWSEGLFSFSPPFPGTKTWRALKSRKEILRLLEEIVERRQRNSGAREDVLSLLLKANDKEGNLLPLEEIKDQVLNLLFAGHETIASALTFVCQLLVQHPSALEKCRQEQERFNADKTLSYSSLNQMSYLNWVLKETLRLKPPVGGGFRKVIKDCSFNNYFIPRGWSVVYEIATTHLDSSLFEEPHIFSPERFDPKKHSDISLGNYIPFGGGIRRCLGENLANLEMKMFASLLIKDYEWEIVSGQSLEVDLFPLPHPRDNLKVTFQRRRNKHEVIG